MGPVSEWVGKVCDEFGLSEWVIYLCTVRGCGWLKYVGTVGGGSEVGG